jgi:UDP-glucose 4-epimerase
MVEGATGTTLRVAMQDAEAGDVKCTWADLGRVRGELGYTARTGIEESIFRQVEFARRYNRQEVHAG